MRSIPRYGLVLVAGLLAACQGEPGRDNETPPDTMPLTGGSCSYTQIAFHAVIDSVAPDRTLLVQMLDSLPASAAMCVADAGANRRWVRASSTQESLSPGDTIEIGGDVIQMGTCTPCDLHARRITEPR